jgi:hypothetical protein
MTKDGDRNETIKYVSNKYLLNASMRLILVKNQFITKICSEEGRKR